MLIFIATIALNVALVSSLRVNRLTKVHHHRVKKTQLQILPHPISDVVELLIKIKIPAIVFGTGYARFIAIFQTVISFDQRLWNNLLLIFTKPYSKLTVKLRDEIIVLIYKYYYPDIMLS